MDSRYASTVPPRPRAVRRGARYHQGGNPRRALKGANREVMMPLPVSFDPVSSVFMGSLYIHSLSLLPPRGRFPAAAP